MSTEIDGKFSPFLPDHTPIQSIPASLVKQPIPETVCEEAQRIVYGDREHAYDHPARNFERIALLWTAHLRAKYGMIVPAIEPHDVAWMMMQVKQGRQIHMNKRDNVVDAIGYIACVQKMIDYEEQHDDNRSQSPGDVS